MKIKPRLILVSACLLLKEELQQTMELKRFSFSCTCVARAQHRRTNIWRCRRQFFKKKNEKSKIATIRCKILRYRLQLGLYILIHCTSPAVPPDTTCGSHGSGQPHPRAPHRGCQILVIFISPIGQTVGGQVKRLKTTTVSPSFPPKPSFASYLTPKIRGV